jgi:hypothetical protein
VDAGEDVKPVRTAESNLVYKGQTPDVADLHCERLRPGLIASVWWLTPGEREAIARGANIRLEIFTEPISPVRLGVTPEQGVGEDAPDMLERIDALRGAE